jgi:hypothetical protein
MTAALQLANRVLEGEDPKRFLKRVTPRKEHKLHVGEEVIRGTGITRDILDACLYRLEQLDPVQYAAELDDSDVATYREQGEAAQLPDFDPEDYTYEHLFGVMQKYCPPWTYFGSYEADGSIGCWPPDPMAREEMNDTGQLTWFDDDHGAQSEAVRRGDYTGIQTRYVLIDYDGDLELWDSQRHEIIWSY